MDIKKLNEAIAKALKEELKPIKAIKPTKEQQEFLDYIKEQIKNEVGISYGEYADLEDLQPQIVYLGDIELAQYAGIDEEVWNISTSMPEHLKPVRANKKVIKEDSGDTVYLFLGKDNSDIVVYSPESLIKYANNQCDYEINDEVDAFNFFKNNGYDIIETTIE